MSVVTYKCPNCGGPLTFNAEGQNWKCDFCLSTFNNEDIQGQNNEDPKKEDEEKKQQETSQNAEFEANAKTYSCPSCGAEIVTDATTAATFCYYCHNPTIIPGQLSGKYRPAKVIPYKFDRNAATEIFKNWCKKKPLLSKSFTTSSQLELLSGIYIPFWLFDCDTRGKIVAECKNIRTWTSGDKRYTETKFYSVMRAGVASFNGVPADGSKKMDDKLMEILEPYDYNEMQDFSMTYLSGYFAEKYDVDLDGVMGRLSERINSYSTSLLNGTINGYDSVYVKECSNDIFKTGSQLVLLPTWMFTYKYKDKTYIFAMNGQTGKIAGNLPLSGGRMAAWFGAISAIIFTIIMLGGILL